MMSSESKDQPGWYGKLNEYFPEHEMKHKDQLEALIKHKDDYTKEETDDYVILYAEFPEFLFIDYLLVTSNQRGKGTGSKVLDSLKQKDKLIILEAEPIDEEDPDTRRRQRFYMKNGFTIADNIEYTRTDDEGKTFQLHVLYWAPERESQQHIYEKMRKACQEVHNFRSKRYYGKPLADPDETLEYKRKNE